MAVRVFFFYFFFPRLDGTDYFFMVSNADSAFSASEKVSSDLPTKMLTSFSFVRVQITLMLLPLSNRHCESRRDNLQRRGLPR